MLKVKENIDKHSDFIESVCIFIVSGMIGVIIFLLTYDVQVLDVTNDSWLMQGGDITQHYLGWRFYRSSPWQLQFGLIEGILYPFKLSIIFTDSIPIFAVLFKILSPILPETFQYFGIWGVFSFFMTGGIASVVIKKFTKNKYICIIGSVFFSFSPFIFQRMYSHTALAGHWIILLAIAIWVYRSYFNSLKRQLLAWMFLLCIGELVHIYYVPMIIIIMGGFYLHEFLETKKIKNALIVGISSVVSALLILFLFGAFGAGGGLSEGGLGYYSANLNALWNPIRSGFSRIMPALAARDGQGEGFGYLGFGMICMVTISLIVWIGMKIKQKRWLNQESISLTISLTAVFAIFAILAVSPTITFNDKILFVIPYPQIIYSALSIFRASGRFIWPIGYLIMFCVIRYLCKLKRDTIKIAILSFFIILQIYDISTIAMHCSSWIKNAETFNSLLISDKWGALTKEYKHIVFIPYENIKENLPLLYSFAYYASENNMTINYFYTARVNEAAVLEQMGNYLYEIENDSVGDDIIFVFLDKSAVNTKLNIMELDGITIGVKSY